MRTMIALLSGLAASTAACGDAVPTRWSAQVAVSVAALDLAGVGDVVWDVEVSNGAGAVVWQRRLTSSGYGDGGGSASYVGPCDADPAVAQNTVKVWVAGIYTAPVAVAGPFAFGATTGIVPGAAAPIDFDDPTATAPLQRAVPCAANADAAVHFDVALMRPASQGFFDISLNFNDIFCSAKVDCCKDADLSGGCAEDGREDLELLFDASGARARTVVLGFACTAGRSGVATTALYLDDLALDCTDGATFAADVTVNPDGPNGNQCGAGAMTGCAPRVAEHGGFDADTVLFQVGVYRGTESLSSGGVPVQKLYWNVALGGRPDLSLCTLRTRGTADDAADPGDRVDAGAIAAGAVYPYVAFDVDLGACTSMPLTFGDAGAVRPRYTDTAAATPTTFAHVWAPGFTCTPACGNGGSCVGPNQCACVGGFTGSLCELAPDPCASVTCLNGGSCAAPGGVAACVCPVGFGGSQCALLTGEIQIPAGTFYLGCSQYEESQGWCPSVAELPRHLVTLSAHAIDRSEVTAAAYAQCVQAGACSLPCSADNSCPALPGLTNATYGVAGRETRPVNFVTWPQAAAYCAWGGKPAGVQRLCTEAEWERAARGGCETVSVSCEPGVRIYPWDPGAGSAAYVSPTSALANFGWAFGEPRPIGSFTPAGDSPYGTYDMAGNVWEWVADWDGPYLAAAATDPTGPASGSARVLRGGGFGSDAAAVRTSWRASNPESAAGDDLGLRCCRTLSGP